MNVYGMSKGLQDLLDFESRLSSLAGRTKNSEQLRREVQELVPEDLTDRRNLDRLYQINDRINRLDRMYQIASEHFAELADEIRAGVAILYEGTILFANPTLLEIVGATSLQEVIGRQSREFIDKSDWEDFGSDPGRRVREVTIKRLDGTHVLAECTRRRLSYDDDARLTVIRLEYE